MSKKINKYALKAQRQSTLAGVTEISSKDAKGSIKKTVVVTGKDIVVGGLGGALAGSVMGRPSLLLGILVTAGGHYFGSPTTAMFGVGMMASGGYQSVNSAMHGVEKEGFEGVKERLSNFAEVLKRQFYIDKLPFKKNGSDEGTNGMGKVQYIKHQNDSDFAEANKIEADLENMALQFANKNGVSGDLAYTVTTEMDGLDGEVTEKLI